MVENVFHRLYLLKVRRHIRGQNHIDNERAKLSARIETTIESVAEMRLVFQANIELAER